MKAETKARGRQLKLPWLDLKPTELPADKERELAQALAELLLGAAMENGVETSGGGEDDEPETNS